MQSVSAFAVGWRRYYSKKKKKKKKKKLVSTHTGRKRNMADYKRRIKL